jgi:UDPglucose 6-dehydrogenase
MRVAMIGAGYVGLVSGVCFADFGHQVTCIDKDMAKIAALNRGEIPIFEPGLSELIESNVRQGRLEFAAEASRIGDADAVFIAVGTYRAAATAMPTSALSINRRAKSRRCLATLPW